MQGNRMFDEMLKAARAWLRDRDAADIARRAGVDFDGSAFCFESLGVPVRIAYPSYAITPEVEPWQQLLVLHYLHLADGFPVSDEKITFSQYKDGMIRGGDFDRRVEQAVRQKLGQLPPETLQARCAALGGREIASNADLSVEIPALPRLNVLLKLWYADEEFDASGRLLLDGSAAHYLTIEDAVMLGELILERLSA